jgi:hypothetical protein
MTIISRQGSDKLPQIVSFEEIDKRVTDLETEMDRLEKKVTSTYLYAITNSVWGDRIIMVGKISAIIMAAVGTAYLTTVIFHFVMGSAMNPLVAGFISVVIGGELGADQAITLEIDQQAASQTIAI